VTAVAESVCDICRIPADAGFFDDSRVAPVPGVGQELVLAKYQLHPSYCGTLLYFAQFTDEQAASPAKIETPGLEWQIRCNGQPRHPYLTFDRIINPWGLAGFPVHQRLEEGCLVEFVVRALAAPPPAIGKVGGRVLGRYWYNSALGSFSSQ
jgi:hypothetical protein